MLFLSSYPSQKKEKKNLLDPLPTDTSTLIFEPKDPILQSRLAAFEDLQFDLDGSLEALRQDSQENKKLQKNYETIFAEIQKERLFEEIENEEEMNDQ